MYVPGIRLPEGLSQPRQRLTLVSVLTGTFSSDTHPPGYYVLMWAWTKCFGAGIWSIRIPAALLGLGCVPLLLWLGLLLRQPAAAWIGAALLAVNGHHVFWSRTARMFSLTCFLGLLATVLLLYLLRTKRSNRPLAVAYVVVLLLGLSAHVFFWLVLGTHGLWILWNEWSNSQSMPSAFRLQILAFILGSPLLAFSAYQSGTFVAPLSNAVGVYAREFVQFAFVLPLQGFSTGLYLPSGPFPPIDDTHVPGWHIAFLLLSLVLLFAGVLALSQKQRQEVLRTFDDGPSAKIWVTAASLAMLAILAFVFVARRILGSSAHGTLRTTEAMSIMPFLVTALAIVLERCWGRFRGEGPRLGMFAGGQGLIVMLALVPFAILLAASGLTPMLNARGMMFLDPYLLLVLAVGFISVFSKNRWVGIVLILLLALVHIDGLREYRPMATDPTDYQSLVKELSAKYRQDDIVFVQPGLWTTPFLYYMTPDRYRLVGDNYRHINQKYADSRVWVIVSYHQALSDDMRSALQNRHLVASLKAAHAEALLYSPESGSR